ncbi:NADPH:quinone oxidoreductase [Labilithrix luteola]|uniref:NADPH:quinone oxidoreductase n=1 Tax=Labilithrix luteola TaxID=1391654 RepID=A0A0K1PXD6_9BACT|nr:NAD(P)H-dependent oxidoreductase [Labilithrix luteola]AKU97789.1 NADPH:quinone oxidoreductase [Labilithrix luteola]
MTKTAALLLGSTRASGWTRKLGRALALLAPPDLEVREIVVADLPLYHEELEPREPPEWARFRAEMRAVDALLFVTPEYNRSIPAMLKNAIDIGSSPEEHSVWSGKPAAVASFSPGMLGGFGANHHLRQALVFLDVPVLQQPEIYLSQIDRLFDEEERLRDGPGKELLVTFMQAFDSWIALGG